MIQSTSLEAFEEIKPKINERQLLILRFLYNFGENTNRMISETIKLPINSVTPRVNELVKKSLVIESKKAICLATLKREKIKRRAIYWEITPKGRKVVEFRNRKEREE